MALRKGSAGRTGNLGLYVQWSFYPTILQEPKTFSREDELNYQNLQRIDTS